MTRQNVNFFFFSFFLRIAKVRPAYRIVQILEWIKTHKMLKRTVFESDNTVQSTPVLWLLEKGGYAKYLRIFGIV